MPEFSSVPEAIEEAIAAVCEDRGAELENPEILRNVITKLFDGARKGEVDRETVTAWLHQLEMELPEDGGEEDSE